MKLRLSSCDKWHAGVPATIREIWAHDHRRQSNPYRRFECRLCRTARDAARMSGETNARRAIYGVIALNWKAPEFV